MYNNTSKQILKTYKHKSLEKVEGMEVESNL